MTSKTTYISGAHLVGSNRHPSWNSPHWANLLLYRGRCNANGIGEIFFSHDRKNHELIERASQVVKRYLSCESMAQRIEVSGTEGVVCSERKAARFIRSAEKEISGAVPIIHLTASKHGKIVFDRKIRFEGWVCSKRTELLSALARILQENRSIHYRNLVCNLTFGPTTPVQIPVGTEFCVK